MIQVETDLDVADNSGARRVRCIRVLGGSGRRVGSVGDLIVVAGKEAMPRGRVKKGEVLRAGIVRAAKDVRRAERYFRRLERFAVEGHPERKRSL